MSVSVYSLFGLQPTSCPFEILEKCKSHCEQWTLASVTDTLKKTQSLAEASVNAQRIHTEGEIYLKSSAAILLDPSARQCYDAFLNATQSNATTASKKLTRSRLLWFNSNASDIVFSQEMIDMIQIEPNKTPKKKQKRCIKSKPHCRECLAPFDFNQPYLVLQCHCTTRVGHPTCLEGFNSRVGGKCPVCRQTLLKRQQVSKYLFWNVKQKYKFIS